MHITRSLNSALHHLRDRHRNRLVWADAICINQGDVKELNQQVKQMGWVYRLAAHTVIYLGEGTPQTKLFIETLQSKSMVDWKPPYLEPDSTEHVQLALVPEVEAAAREWILAQPWFSRVWILQGLVLSRDPWIQCGTSVMRWSSWYGHISEIATRRALKIEEMVVENMEKLHIQHQSASSKIQGHANDAHNRLNFAQRLFRLLKSRKGFGATDPRDILFANLGLLGPVPEDEYVGLIAVDYRKNEAEVFLDLARYFVENLCDIEIFSLLDSNEKRRNTLLPSWAPDWASRPPSEFARFSDYLPYDRSSFRDKQLILTPEARVLVCGGKFVGLVKELGRSSNRLWILISRENFSP